MLNKSRLPIGTRRKTSDTCPESGIWKVVEPPTTTMPLAEGNTFPPYLNRAVTYELIQYA